MAVSVDSEVESGLLNNSNVNVIVMLKNQEQPRFMLRRAMAADDRKATISSQQERFIRSLEEINKSRIQYKYSSINALSLNLSAKEIEELKNNPYVKSIRAVKTYSINLNASRIVVNASKSYSLRYNNTNISGKGQSVCIIDTGIDSDHTYLQSRIVHQHCFCTSGGSGCCPNGQSEDTSAEDGQGHGTHVAGIVASIHPIFKGIAYGAGIVAIKCLSDSGAGDDPGIIAGIDWCVSNASKFNISVISMSLGGSALYDSYCDSSDTAMAAAIDAAVAQNISVVVSTGNNNKSSTITSPACIKNATPVSSTDDRDMVSTFSNRNSLVQLLAPGTNITSTYKNNGLAIGSGTSMAAPHVSAAFALLNQFRKINGLPVLMPQQIEDVLNDTGRRINDSYGAFCNHKSCSNLTYSRINIYDALLSMDSVSPVINITSPENSSASNQTSVMVMVSANELLADAIVDWNGTNYTMNGSGQNFYRNITSLGQGRYDFRVYGADLANNTGLSETRTYVVNFSNENSAPVITAKYPNSTIISIDSRQNQTFNVTVFEPDNDNYSIRWYLNSTIAAQGINYTFRSNSSINRSYSYNVTVRVNDTNHTVEEQWNLIVSPYVAGANCINVSNNTGAGDRFNLTNSTPFCHGNYSLAAGILLRQLDNIVIDCNGSTITGNGNGTGIYLDRARNITVKNCNINNYAQGIYLYYVENVTIASNNLTNNSRGIFSTGSANHTNISYNTFLNNTQSIMHEAGNNITAEYNYWGTGISSLIDSHITDYNDNESFGQVDYDPWYIDASLATDSDNDDDGYTNSSLGGSDCDDANASIMPYAAEVLNNVDDNCNNIIDEGFVIGNASLINSSTITPNVTVNGSTNLSLRYNGSKGVVIRDNSTAIVEFQLNFSRKKLNLSNITVEKQSGGYGYVIVKGISLDTGRTKSVYVDNASLADGVCIKDIDMSDITSITENCTGTKEYFVPCPGSRNSYRCTVSGERYRISGLNHSGVRQSNDTVAPEIINTSIKYSGSSTVTLYFNATTDENASCRYDTVNRSYENMTYAFSGNGTKHLSTRQFTSSASGTYYVRCNDSYGNVMMNSSVAGYAVSVSTAQTTSGSGGGGGGGGGAARISSSKVNYYYDTIVAGEEKKMRISRHAIPLKELYFSTAKQASRVTVSVSPVSNLSELPGGLENVYQALKIEHPALSNEDIESARLVFAVNKSWLASNGLDKSKVRLMRYTTIWRALRSNKINESGKEIYYYADSPGLSYFAVTAGKKVIAQKQSKAEETEEKQETVQEVPENTNETKEEAEEDEPDSRPLSAMVSLVILLVVILALRYSSRRKSKPRDDKLVREFIASCRDAGITYKRIKESLIKEGWKKKLIEQELNKFRHKRR